MIIPKLHYISQGNSPEEHLENIQKACTSGVELVQLRLKDVAENKFLKIGRNKGFISNLEDLSSLKPDNKNFNQILKSKKTQVIGLSVILASMILLFYLL